MLQSLSTSEADDADDDTPGVVYVFTDTVVYTLHVRLARIQTAMNWIVGQCSRACSSYRVSRRCCQELGLILRSVSSSLKREPTNHVGALRLLRLVGGVISGDIPAEYLPADWDMNLATRPAEVADAAFAAEPKAATARTAAAASSAAQGAVVPPMTASARADSSAEQQV